ncbi:MAG: POTRA domain-containing protein [Kosmotogaceae bacterium]
MHRKLILIFVFVMAVVSIFSAITINQIIVEGNETISDKEILNMLSVSTTKPIEENTLESSIEKLRNTGYFSEVNFHLEKETGKLTVNVKEYPVVDVSLNYDGPEIIKKETLIASSLNIKNNYPLDPKKLIYEIPKTEEKIYATIQSKGYAEQFFEVSWDLSVDRSKLFSGNVTEDIEITFNIKVYYLWDIEIEAPLSEKIIKNLKEKLELKLYLKYVNTADILNIFKKKTDYIPTNEVLVNTVRTLYSTYYANKEGPWGLKNAYQAMSFTLSNSLNTLSKVTLPEGEKGQAKVMTLSFKPAQYITEPFKLNAIFVEGNINVPELLIVDSLQLEEGTTIKNEDVANALENVYELYSDRGYPFTKISLKTNEQQGFLTLVVKEMKINKIEVNFKGDHKTQDYLVDKNISFNEGEILTMKKFRNTYSFLNSTGYYDSVSLNPVPTDNDEINVIIELDEKEKNGKIMGGGGWSDGISLNLDLGFVNPFGYGQDFSTNVNALIPLKISRKISFSEEGTKTTFNLPTYDVNFSYNIPMIAGSNWDLGTSASYQYDAQRTVLATQTETSLSTITEESTHSNIKISLSPTYRFSPASRFKTTAGYEYISEISSIATETTGEPTISGTPTNKNFNGLFVRTNYLYSTKDDLQRPTQGNEFSVNLYSHGLFSSGSNYSSFIGGSIDYKQFIQLGSRALLSGDDAPVFGARLKIEQLYPFEDSSIYGSYKLIPDIYTRVKYQEVTGVKAHGITTGSLQLRLPVWSKTIPADIMLFGDIVFYRETRDISDIIGTDYLFDAGISLDFSVPMLGLIRVGWGYNSLYHRLKTESGKPYWGTFFFGMGPVF